MNLSISLMTYGVIKYMHIASARLIAAIVQCPTTMCNGYRITWLGKGLFIVTWHVEMCWWQRTTS
jgi:hypothetical protein